MGLSEYGEPEVSMVRSPIGWSARIAVPACPADDRFYLGYVKTSTWGLTKRGTERRIGRMVRRLREHKVFVF